MTSVPYTMTYSCVKFNFLQQFVKERVGPERVGPIIMTCSVFGHSPPPFPRAVASTAPISCRAFAQVGSRPVDGKPRPHIRFARVEPQRSPNDSTQSTAG